MYLDKWFTEHDNELMNTIAHTEVWMATWNSIKNGSAPKL